MQEYTGEKITFGKEAGNHRIHRGHFRRFFYVYSYASGFLIAKSMETMLHEEKISIHQIKEFLSAGTSKSPREIFQDLGIDITQPTFRREGLNGMQNYLEETILLAEQISGKRL